MNLPALPTDWRERLAEVHALIEEYAPPDPLRGRPDLWGPSGWADHDLRVMVKRGDVIREYVDFPAPSALDEVWTDDEVRDRFREGSIRHRRLCALAALWMDGLGLLWASRKGRLYAGGMADVKALDGSVVAECGHCESSKIINGVGGSDRWPPAHVLHVPYSDQYWVDPPVLYYHRDTPPLL